METSKSHKFWGHRSNRLHSCGTVRFLCEDGTTWSQYTFLPVSDIFPRGLHDPFSFTQSSVMTLIWLPRSETWHMGKWLRSPLQDPCCTTRAVRPSGVCCREPAGTLRWDSRAWSNQRGANVLFCYFLLHLVLQMINFWPQPFSRNTLIWKQKQKYMNLPFTQITTELFPQAPLCGTNFKTLTLLSKNLLSHSWKYSWLGLHSSFGFRIPNFHPFMCEAFLLNSGLNG